MKFAGQAIITLTFVFAAIVTLGCENPVSVLTSIVNLRLLSDRPSIGNGNSASLDDDAKADSGNAATELVRDWEKPEVTLFITGRLHGYIEPCGCTGLTNQKGGLLRRHTCQKLLKEKGFDPVCIDAGNQIRRFGQQPSIKLKTAYQAIAGIMNYDAIGMGIDDTKVSGADMALSIAESKPEVNPFTSANLLLFDDDSFTSPFKIVERAGKKIAVVSVIGSEHVRKVLAAGGNDEYTLTMPETALAKIVADPNFSSCDVKVLIAQSAPENCKTLARKFPVFDLLVTAGSAGDPTLQPEAITVARGMTTQMIQCGVKGMYVGVVGVNFQGPLKKIRYQRVALDASFKDSPEVREAFLAYQEELKSLWLGGLLEDIKPRPHPSGHKFVGSEACADCHEEEFDIWKDGHDGDGGPHFKATKDLTDPGERTWVKRNYDPECVSCHVTGWSPQNYYPYESGYMDLAKDTLLHGNGCENCHGPGSAHVAAENDGINEALQEKLRKEMIVTKEQAKTRMCFSCHDLDNSPDYAEAEDGWEKYWPTVAHGEDD
jgi:hypothetical protein